MKEGVGRNSGCSAPPAPSSSAYALLSSSRSLRSRSSHTDASLFLSRGWDQPPTSMVEVQDRLAAALVGEAELPDLEPAFTSPCLSQHLRPQDFLLVFPERAPLEEMLPRLGPVRASQTLSSRLFLRPREVLSSETMARLQLVEPRSEPLVGGWGPSPVSGVVPGVGCAGIPSR